MGFYATEPRHAAPYPSVDVRSQKRYLRFSATPENTHPLGRSELPAPRYYTPEMGRWVSRAPIGETGGLHLYGYSANDPIGLTDPLGTEALDPDGDGIPDFHVCLVDGWEEKLAKCQKEADEFLEWCEAEATERNRIREDAINTRYNRCMVKCSKIKDTHKRIACRAKCTFIKALIAKEEQAYLMELAACELAYVEWNTKCALDVQYKVPANCPCEEEFRVP